MSTYWGYACISHDPPLVSEHWINHGDEVLREAYDLERCGEWPDDPMQTTRMAEILGADPAPVISPGGSPYAAPIPWLRLHPHCEVVLHNEYGEIEILGPTVVGDTVRAIRT